MVRKIYRDTAPRSRSTSMPQQQRRPHLEVEVRDFGPIAKGKVELRPLTVFAGPSNTGKSWLATLIYAAWKALPESSKRLTLPTFMHSQNNGKLESALNSAGLTFFPEEPELWSKAIEEKTAVRLTEKENLIIGTYLSMHSDRVKSEILRCLSIPECAQAIRWGSRNAAKINIKIGVLQHVIKIGKASNKVSLATERIFSLAPDFFSKDSHRYYLEDYMKQRSAFNEISQNEMYDEAAIGQNITLCIRHLYEMSEIEEIHYFPSDRGGIMRTHAAIVNSLIERASGVGFRGEHNSPMLSGVLSDVLKNLVQIGKLPSDEKYYENGLELGLAKNVLFGRIEVVRSELGYPHFFYRQTGQDERISLRSASSMVSEMGALALFLKYYIMPGDLLIIDEPEAHLHPGLQCSLVVELAKLVQRGVRIILTTHSDWVLSELSNIVARSVVKNWEVVDDDEVVLSTEDVGIWNFVNAKESGASGGSRIEEVCWDPNGAGYEAGFYDVLVKKNNEWADIMDHYDWSGEEQ